MQIVEGKLALFVGTGKEGTGTAPDPNWYSNSSIPNGQWTHVLVTRNEERVALYINGSMDYQSNASQPSDISFNGNSYDHAVTQIGRAYPNGLSGLVQSFGGTMSDVALWNRELSQEHIEQIASGNFDYFVSGPVGFWPMDEGTGTLIVDKSGMGRNGQLQGSANWSTNCPQME